MPPRLLTPPPEVLDDLTNFGNNLMTRIGGGVRSPVARAASSVGAAAGEAERQAKIYVPLVLIAVTLAALLWSTIQNLAVPALARALPTHDGPGAENRVQTQAGWIIGTVFIAVMLIVFLALRRTITA